MRRIIGLLLVLFSTLALAQDAAKKPATLTADKVLNAYEAALKAPATAPLTGYHLAYGIYSELGRHEPLVQIEVDSLADGRYVKSDFSTTVRSRSGFDGKRFWHSGIPIGIVNLVEYKTLFGYESNSERPFSYGINFAPPSPGWRKKFKDFAVLGQAMVSNDRAIVIRGTLNSGLAVNLYFDAKTFLLRRADIPVKFKNVNDDDRVFEVTRYFEKYRDIAGWQIPSVIREDQPHGSIDYVLQKFDVNPAFDESMFEHRN